MSVRVREHKVLKFLSETCDKVLKIFEMTDEEAVQAAENIPGAEIYVKLHLLPFLKKARNEDSD